MPSVKKVNKSLRELDPHSDEFCVVAAGYFREHARAHRNYGRFFIGVGIMSWVGVFAATGRLFIWWQIFSFCFASGVGWLVLIGAKRTAHALAQIESESDTASRLKSLCQVALMQPLDPVSLLIFERTKTTPVPPGAEP
jgi:hypothetical protein